MASTPHAHHYLKQSVSSPSSPIASPAGTRRRLASCAAHQSQPSSNSNGKLYLSSPRHSSNNVGKTNAAKDILHNLLSDLMVPFRRKSCHNNMHDSGVLFRRGGEEDMVMIEMDCFGPGIIPMPLSRMHQKNSNLGHDFLAIPLIYPAWCDKCSDIMLGLDQDTCLKCQNCQYTCHHRCQHLINLECLSTISTNNNSSTTSQLLPVPPSLKTSSSSPVLPPKSSPSSLKSEKQRETSLTNTQSQPVLTGREEIVSDNTSVPVFDGTFIFIKQSDVVSGLPPSWSCEELRDKLTRFNNNSQGVHMTMLHDGITFRGFIRVHFDLHRPISICAGTRPPSIFDIIQTDLETNTMTNSIDEDTIKQSFYIPKGTVKALHITSDTRVVEVIQALLKKFKVADSPHKFSLYEKIISPTNKYKYSLRRLLDEERPLYICLSWGEADIHQERFVLQENETGEVQWDAFTLPELQNFLLILEKEESERREDVKKKYELLREKLEEASKFVLAKGDRGKVEVTKGDNSEILGDNTERLEDCFESEIQGGGSEIEGSDKVFDREIQCGDKIGDNGVIVDVFGGESEENAKLFEVEVNSNNDDLVFREGNTGTGLQNVVGNSKESFC